MYQIDTSDAVSSLPTPGAAGTPGYFNGVAPFTTVTNDFLNMTMMELINVVTAAGETQSKTTYTQLLTALATMFSPAGRGVQTFTSSGTFTVPANVYAVVVEVWGAGAGSYASTSSLASGGASGGGYARKCITGLTPGSTITVTVGIGGAAGTTSGPTAPTAGGTSSFGSYVSATGGGLNSAATVTSPAFGGNNPGHGISGDSNFYGGTGTNQPGLNNGGTGGGGAAGGGFSNNAASYGLAGQFPGGGASGAGLGTGGSTAQNGAAGANGLVVVRW